MRSRKDYEPEVWESDKWNLKRFNYYEKNSNEIQPVRRMTFPNGATVIFGSDNISVRPDAKCYYV